LRSAYTDREKAFKRYSDYYLSTNGQTYWSDTNQLSAYLPNYAQKIREQIGGDESSLIITEIYVPRPDLPDFLAQAADLLRSNRTTVIYGTVRLIEKDDESFLAWAKQSYACIIFNLLTLHTPSGIEASARSFRGLIDLAIARGGSYYLTYHKFAKPEQVIACYPQFKEFLDLKRKYDPAERFQSDWYRYYRKLFATDNLVSERSETSLNFGLRLTTEILRSLRMTDYDGSMSPFAIIALVLILARAIAELWLSRLNQRHVRAHADEVPPSYREMVDEPTYRRSVDYTLAKNRFGDVVTVFDAGAPHRTFIQRCVAVGA
jgi:hypothetical protein